MEIISFFESDRQQHWLDEIQRSDWNAGPFLVRLLRNGTFFDEMGEGSRVLLLTDGSELISYCTYVKTDDIRPTDLTPWIGFVYTFPSRRGHRYAGRLLDEVCRLAEKEGVAAVYLSTDHTGLYEKYGFTYLTMMTDMEGHPSRIYVRRTRAIRTERLLLRRFRESDYDDLLEFLSQLEDDEYEGYPGITYENGRTHMNDRVGSTEYWAVELVSAGKVIGNIYCGARDFAAKEVGYIINKDYQRQGYAAEALSAVIRNAFR